MAAADTATTVKRTAAKSSPAKVAAEIAKLTAEAAEHTASAELLREQAADAKLERKITAARLRSAESEAIAAEIAAKDVQRTEERYLAQDALHHVYQFGSAVTSATVKSCIDTLSSWSRRTPGCDIELIINSPGGSVIDGFALWDFLTELKAKGHNLTTVCRGMAASMGGILLQAGDVRVIGSESVILVHEISFGTAGKIGEVEDEVAFAKMLTQRVLNIFANRTKMSKQQIATKWKRKDWWLDSDEALRLGFADVIR